MIKITKISLFLLPTSLLFFTACSNHSTYTPQPYSYSGVYFGKNFPQEYKQGIVDGCETSKGKYQKSHTLFQTSKYYEEGWFLGRNRCKDLLTVRK